MARHAGPVLVDTNVIFGSFRIGAWRALSSGYALETVEDCVTETQTGFQRRRAEQRIDAAALRASLTRVHSVGGPHLAALAVLAPDTALDVGERSLWAHAVTRTDGWLLCGPDKASLRLGVSLGCRDRLVALERLLAEAGYRPAQGRLYESVAGNDARPTRAPGRNGADMTNSGEAARAAIVEMFRRDLVGPLPPDVTPGDADLQTERLAEAPSSWYLTGFIAPVEESAGTADDDPDRQEEAETEAGETILPPPRRPTTTALLKPRRRTADTGRPPSA